MIFAQFDWLLSSEYPRTMYIPTGKNTMVSFFVPFIDKQIFGGTNYEAAVSPNTKKAIKVCLAVCIEVFFKAISNA